MDELKDVLGEELKEKNIRAIIQLPGGVGER